MGLFTQDELKPSEQTLNLIRQVAYTYRVVRIGAKKCFALTNVWQIYRYCCIKIRIIRRLKKNK